MDLESDDNLRVRFEMELLNRLSVPAPRTSSRL